MTTVRFIAIGSALFSFEMISLAFFTQGLLKSIVIGLIIGAILGAALGLIVGIMVENSPWEDRATVSPMSGHTLQETKTGMKATILGLIFGVVGIVILEQFVPPAQGAGRFVLAAMFGATAGGGTVGIGFRV